MTWTRSLRSQLLSSSRVCLVVNSKGARTSATIDQDPDVRLLRLDDRNRNRVRCARPIDSMADRVGVWAARARSFSEDKIRDKLISAAVRHTPSEILV